MALMHEIFVLDAELQSQLDFEKRQEITRSFIDDMLNELQMQELGPLNVFDATDVNFPGWSFIQPITTSHISGHYFEEQNSNSHIHLDIYSCKGFDWNTALLIVHKHFHLAHWSASMISRAISVTQRKSLHVHGVGEKLSS